MTQLAATGALHNFETQRESRANVRSVGIEATLIRPRRAPRSGLMRLVKAETEPEPMETESEPTEMSDWATIDEGESGRRTPGGKAAAPGGKGKTPRRDSKTSRRDSKKTPGKKKLAAQLAPADVAKSILFGAKRWTAQHVKQAAEEGWRLFPSEVQTPGLVMLQRVHSDKSFKAGEAMKTWEIIVAERRLASYDRRRRNIHLGPFLLFFRPRASSRIWQRPKSISARFDFSGVRPRASLRTIATPEIRLDPFRLFRRWTASLFANRATPEILLGETTSASAEIFAARWTRASWRI